jgi:hypothetical protein
MKQTKREIKATQMFTTETKPSDQIDKLQITDYRYCFIVLSQNVIKCSFVYIRTENENAGIEAVNNVAAQT